VIKLSYDPIIKQELMKAFPSPKQPHLALNKYIALLEELMNDSVSNGRSDLALENNGYDIRSSVLTNKIQIGKHGQRLHTWLLNNKLSLVKNLVHSTVSNKKIGVFIPTKYLTITDYDSLDYIRNLNDLEFEDYFNSMPQEWIHKNQTKYQYHNLQKLNNENLDFHSVKVDTDSLKNFLSKLRKSEVLVDRKLELRYFEDINKFLRVTQYNDGYLHQRINYDANDFGRTYYFDVSVQSIKRELRKVLLGDSWEYDSVSCAPSWKFSFAEEWYINSKSKNTFGEEFQYTILLLENKNIFFDAVIDLTFPNDSLYSYDVKRYMVKRAVNAIGFGAKATDKKFPIDGYLKESSLLEIFDEQKSLLSRFVKNEFIVGFSKEQTKLINYIVKKFSSDIVWQEDLERIRLKNNKKITQSRKLAWLFQHAETIMMDKVRVELKKLNKTVLANVHDAIVIRERLSEKEREMIEKEVREYTKVEYFALGETKYSTS
jgi:hypothetical protein